MEREAEAEETGRPPETKLTKGRGKIAEPVVRDHSGESLHWKWENKVRRKGRRERERGGEIKWTAQEKGWKDWRRQKDSPMASHLSLSFLLSFSRFPSLFLPINHSDFSLTNSFPAGGKKSVTIFLSSAISLSLSHSLLLLLSLSLSGLFRSLPLSHTQTHLLMHSLWQWR